MCTCQNCNNKYTVDIIVPDDVWNQIFPTKEIKDAGLLCPKCIGEKLEEILGYTAYKLVKI